MSINVHFKLSKPVVHELWTLLQCLANEMKKLVYIHPGKQTLLKICTSYGIVTRLKRLLLLHWMDWYMFYVCQPTGLNSIEAFLPCVCIRVLLKSWFKQTHVNPIVLLYGSKISSWSINERYLHTWKQGLN